MDKEKVEYLKRKINNKEEDLQKYKLVEDLIKYHSPRKAKTILNTNGKRIVVDKNGEKYFIDFKLFPVDEYGLSGYGNFTCGDIIIEKFADIPSDVVKKMIEDSIDEKFLRPYNFYQSMSDVQEENMSRMDINATQTDYEGIAKDFYKKANRIYIANTANSRVALYEYDGKYYISERRRLITLDGYDKIFACEYSKKDELFEEVTEDEIREIFGEESLAKLCYGKNIDTAVLKEEELIPLSREYYKNGGQTIEGLKEKQQDITEIPKEEPKKEVTSDEIAGVSNDMQITTSDVHKNIFTWLLEKAREKLQGRN